MAITVAVKPDLSAFREVGEEDLANAICNASRGVRKMEATEIARALLASHWIVPR